MTKRKLLKALLIVVCCAHLTACGGSSGSGSKSSSGGEATAPSASLDFPPPFSMTQSETVAVRGTALSTENPIEQVLVNGVPAADLSTDGSFSVWTAEISIGEGMNTLEVSVLTENGQTFGNAASAEVLRDVYLGNFPDNEAAFTTPKSVVFVPSSAQIIVGDKVQNALFSVDLLTGKRTKFSVSSDFSTEVPLLNPTGLLVDPRTSALWVADSEGSRVVSVDVSSGKTTIVSKNDETNAAAFISNPVKVAFGGVSSDHLVLADQDGALLSFDTVSGLTEVLSDDTTPDTTSALGSPTALIYDAKRDNFIVGNSSGQLYLVDGQSGTKSLFVEQTAVPGNGPEISGVIHSLALVSEEDELWVLFESADGNFGIISLDLESGISTRVMETPLSSGDNPISQPTDLFYAESLGFFLVTDDEQDAVLAIDPVTKGRVFISKGKNDSNIGLGCECDPSEYEMCTDTHIAQHRGNGPIQSTIFYEFAEPVLCGKFRNGYDFVVAPKTPNGVVTINSVFPASIGSGESLRHGLTVNPNSALDSNLDGRLGIASSSETLPLSINTSTQSISSILKAESWNTDGGCNDAIGEYRRMCFEHIDILTVLNEWPSQSPQNFLRPAFWGNEKELFSIDSIDLGILSNILPQSRPSGTIVHDFTVDDALAYMSGMKADFYRDYPGVQTLKGFANWPGITSGYSPNGWGRFWDHAQWLYLDTDAFGFSPLKKQELAYRIFEHGMDVLEIALNYPSYGPWAPNGGHTSGRYGAALLAATLQKDPSDLAALKNRLATTSGPHTFAETGQISPGNGYAVYGQTSLAGGKTYNDCTDQINSTIADVTGETDVSDYNHPEGGNCDYTDSQVYQDVVWNIWLSQAMLLSAMPAVRQQTDTELLDYVNRLVTTGTKSRANQNPQGMVVDVFALARCNGGTNDGMLAFTKADCPSGTLDNAIAPNFQNLDYASKFGAFMFEQLQVCLSKDECDLP